MLVDIVQNREEYDQQLLVEVYLALLVHGIHVDSTIILHHSICPCNSPSPVDLVESSMHVLDDE